jgi:hypothetical protein
MSSFPEKLKAILASCLELCRKFVDLCRRGIVWISPPPRLCAAILGLVFAVSLIAWSFGDSTCDVVLFFPLAKGNPVAFRGEVRSIPRSSSAEKKAELVASELLLGPMGQGLRPAFAPGVQLRSVLLRKSVLYVDLSSEAALAGRADLATALPSLEKSLHFALPAARRVVITIGGQEPYREGLSDPLPGPKKAEKN